jgi:putative transposase
VFCLTYEFRLNPCKQQISVFEDWLEIKRKVYNYALAQRKHWYKSRSCQVNSCSLHSEYIIPADTPRPTFVSQCKSLTIAIIAAPRFKAGSSASFTANVKERDLKMLLPQCGKTILVFLALRK